MSNWKKGSEMMPHLKFSVHNTTKDLDELIYAAEGVIYFWNNRWVTDKAKQRIMKQITQLGKDLNELKLDVEQTKRRDEAIKQLRIIYKTLDNYYPDDYANGVEEIQKMLNYSVSQYLKKKDNLSFENKLKLAKENKVLWYCTGEQLFNCRETTPKLNCKAFLSMQTELLTAFNQLAILI